MTESIEKLLADASDLAQQAGSLTLDWFRQTDLEVESKIDGTEVTDADRAAERFIREQLGHRYPDHAVYGEEEGGVIDPNKLTWIIDPIDGTRGFTRGVPLYSTLLAVVDDTGPIVGVIYVPALNSTVAAGRGLGCWLDGQRTSVSDTSQLKGALVNTSSYETFANEWLMALKGSGAMMRTWGDAFGYYLVAAGQAEAMIDPVCSSWDLAPMPVILKEAGGRFTDMTGESSIDLNAAPDSISGIASNGFLHDELLEVLKST
ncbi:MAG: inositol monophosphatase family protein [Actinomycetota bacterium]|nr:histidinol phosphate phosphatase [Acidimicrobiaceae bacterium]MEC7916772.1 inositol monophosphatase family protein [Actinomycetota bacterium]MED5361241.1 inositol monophosphatase family protein [Actinomycetota bacterium]MEE3257177.1 inositol monophosphatase family protein [Actinomycetota bacterium]